MKRTHCTLGLYGLLAAALVGCSANIGGGSASITILGETFGISFGNAGIITVTAGDLVFQAAGLRLFDEAPAAAPPSGQMRLLSQDVGVAQLLTDSSRLMVSRPPEGTATITFRIAAGASAALCENATFLSEYQLNVVAGQAAIANEIYELSQEALEVITANDVTLCIEVQANFDGQITLSDFSLTFGGGDDGATANIAMFNQDQENIHILLPGENFDPATNRITPGGERNASLDVNIGDTITVRAGRDGTVLDEVACPAVEEVDYFATVVWNGTQLTCIAQQAGGVPPGTAIFVPINEYGVAQTPNATFNGVNYWLNGVLQSVSPEAPPQTRPSSVAVNLAALGLQYVETVHLAQIAVYVPDVPGGEQIGTVRFDYAEGGPPTTLDFFLGGNTADWAIERPENVPLGWTSQGLGPILYTFDTMEQSASVYDGHAYREEVDLDTSRTLSLITLSVVDVATLTRPANSPTPTWAGMGFIGVTLEGPAGSAGGGPIGGTGTVSGQVVNALTGDPIAGASVSAGGAAGTTDAGGMFTMTGVAAGAQTVIANATGFVQSSTAVVVIGGATTDVQVGLVPIGAAGDRITIVLAWGEAPSDLDLHMSGPDGADGRFHAYFFTREPVPHAALDLDDLDAFGPETLSIQPAGGGDFVPGEYRIWVHNFSGSPGFDAANARVTITAGGSQLGQFPAASASGDASQNIWQVINLAVTADGGVTVTQVQTFTSGNSSSEF